MRGEKNSTKCAEGLTLQKNAEEYVGGSFSCKGEVKRRWKKEEGGGRGGGGRKNRIAKVSSKYYIN